MKARTAAFTFPVLTALMALTLTLARQEGAPPSAPDSAQETGPLVAEGPAPDLTLLYTGGVVGYVEPCG